MAQTNKYVKFNTNGLGAKVFVNPSSPVDGAVFNPNLDLVRGVPPEYWMLVNGDVFPMPLEQRDAHGKMAASIAKSEIALPERQPEIKVIEREVEIIKRVIEIKEVPFEVIQKVFVDVVRDVIIEKPVINEVIKYVEVPVIKEVPVEVVKYIEVPVIKEIEVEKIVTVTKVIYNKTYLVIAGIAVALQIMSLLRNF